MKQFKRKCLLACCTAALTLAVCGGGAAFLTHREASAAQAKHESMLSELRRPVIATNGPTVCSVHNLHLQQDTVAIHYGLLWFPEAYREARSDAFPHANDFHPGGCCPSFPTNAVVLYCSECRRAKAQWTQHNKVEQPAEELQSGSALPD